MSFLPYLDPGHIVMRVILGAVVQSSVVVLLGAVLAYALFAAACRCAARTLAWRSHVGVFEPDCGCGCRSVGVCSMVRSAAGSWSEGSSGRRRDERRRGAGRFPPAESEGHQKQLDGRGS